VAYGAGQAWQLLVGIGFKAAKTFPNIILYYHVRNFSNNLTVATQQYGQLNAVKHHSQKTQ